MRIEIPFIAQAPGTYDCGPTCLRMILQYFGEDHSLQEIQRLVDTDTSGNTWTSGIAKAAGELGFPTEFYTEKLGLNTENFGLEYYQRLSDGVENTQQKIQRLHAACREFGVGLHEQEMRSEDICGALGTDRVAIILVDWNKIEGKEGYKGHFVVLTGYDGTHVTVHQPGPREPTPHYRITYGLFDQARRAPGTDQDIIFVSRKKK
jgi:ABC-type bacteriocin/lantibiotic exporter with double-glycine peptidase domain